MTKYFIQVDTNSTYSSELLEITKDAFYKEYEKCNKAVNENLNDYFVRKSVNRFEDRIQTEYMFGFVYTDIYLIEMEYQ